MFSDRIKSLIPAIQDYFKNKPIVKAWIFGSFSRGEEHPDSDLDILVEYDRKQRISLLKICGYIVDLEDMLKLRVDLVERQGLKEFARKSAEHDKILIYERSQQGDSLETN